MPDYDGQVAMNWVLGFFEDLSHLEEHGRITWIKIRNSWGEPLVVYRAIAEPAIQVLRAASTPLVHQGFERLARHVEAQARGRREDWSISESDLPAVFETQIGRNMAWLRMLRDLESGVIPSEATFGEKASAPARG